MTCTAELSSRKTSRRVSCRAPRLTMGISSYKKGMVRSGSALQQLRESPNKTHNRPVMFFNSKIQKSMRGSPKQPIVFEKTWFALVSQCNVMSWRLSQKRLKLLIRIPFIPKYPPQHHPGRSCKFFPSAARPNHSESASSFERNCHVVTSQ